MSRPLGPYGFRASHDLAGGTPGRLEATEYTIATGYNTQIMIGDFVKRSGNGRDIERADPGDAVIGVFQGCKYLHPDGEIIYRAYWPASQSTKTDSVITAKVMDSPNMVFMAQMDGALTAGDIGQLADLAQTAPGDEMAMKSGQTVGSASIGSGTQVKILGLSPKYAENATYGNQNDVLVALAGHELHTRAAV